MQKVFAIIGPYARVYTTNRKALWHLSDGVGNVPFLAFWLRASVKWSARHDDHVAQVFWVVEANTTTGDLATCESSTDGHYYPNPLQSKNRPLEKQFAYVCVFIKWDPHPVVYISGNRFPHAAEVS
jgi:hypothetical protein